MNKQKQPISLDKIMIAITALSFIATIFIYSSLPTVITYHWGIDGSVKTVGKWVTPITALMPVIIYYVTKLRLKRKYPPVSAFLISLIVILIHWSILFIAKG